jgi:hypothetical protein
MSKRDQTIDREIYKEIRNGRTDSLKYYDAVHRVLYHAAFMGDKGVVEIIIDLFPDAINRPNELRNGSTPLMAACLNTHDHLEVVRFLLERGADTSCQSHRGEEGHGNTAFHWAAVRGAESALKCLLEKNPSGRDLLDGESRTPLEVLAVIPADLRWFDRGIQPNAILLDTGDQRARLQRIHELLLVQRDGDPPTKSQSSESMGGQVAFMPGLASQTCF